MRKQIEEAIRTTLVVKNPKGIKYAVDKIEALCKQAFIDGTNAGDEALTVCKNKTNKR